MITIAISGNKSKVENSVVEAAFAQAIAEAPAERGVLVTLSNAAASKIANGLGLGSLEYTGVGNATRRVFPGALIARVEEILGGAELVGTTWTDPAKEAEARAEWLASAASARYFGHYDDRSNREAGPCHCCGKPLASHDGRSLSRDYAPGHQWAAEVAVCLDCLPSLEVIDWSRWNGLPPARRAKPAASGEFEALTDLERSARRIAATERTREIG